MRGIGEKDGNGTAAAVATFNDFYYRLLQVYTMSMSLFVIYSYGLPQSQGLWRRLPLQAMPHLPEPVDQAHRPGERHLTDLVPIIQAHARTVVISSVFATIQFLYEKSFFAKLSELMSA